MNGFLGKFFDVLPIKFGGTGMQQNPSMLAKLNSSTPANVFDPSPRPGVTGILGVENGGTGKSNQDGMFSTCYPFKPKFYFLDTEELASGVTYKQEREFIKEYVKRLREWGVEVVGQYTGDALWNEQYRDLEPIFDILWIAHWGENTGKYEGQTIKAMKYSNKVVLHQYTSYGYTKVAGAPGINHRIDLNRLTGVKPLSYFTGRTYEGETAATEAADKGTVTLTYTVQQNDTLWEIAKRYYGKGDLFTKIMEANGLTSTVLHTGMILTIPQD